MPLPLEKTPVVPNVLYAPQIVLSTAIVGGQIVTSAQITLMGAQCDNNGVWTRADSMPKTVNIPNIFALDADIAAYAQDVQALFASIVGLIGNINSVRKIL